MHNDSDLLARAREVLTQNDRGNYTQPAYGLYPHQWLWDSCFTAIGLRHLDVERAKTELLSLLRGQWHNGMLPNIIFRDDKQFHTDRHIWSSHLSPQAPDGVATSGITQPPLLAEAVVRVGAVMEPPERRQWYRQMYAPLLAYHQWLYADRDPHSEGLVLLVHPWESGLDNTPPWMHSLHEHQLPAWIRLIGATHLDSLVNLFRRDTRSVPLDQRFSTIEVLALFNEQLRMRRKSYDIDRILDHGLFAIEDLAYNSMLIRANHQLRHIAHNLKEELPAELEASMRKTERALEDLWDDYGGQYYSRDFITHNLIKVPSVATLLPLYAGTIDKKRAAKLVAMIENEKLFGTAFPLPSVPIKAPDFHPKLYWQGPTWININWLVIDGLERYGYADHAAALRESTLEMVQASGFYEYFDPLDGTPAGGPNFSWTAALVIDLLRG